MWPCEPHNNTQNAWLPHVGIDRFLMSECNITHTHTHTHTHAHTRTHMHTRTRTRTCTHTCRIHARTQTCTHTTHTHTHTHTHTQTQPTCTHQETWQCNTTTPRMVSAQDQILWGNAAAMRHQGYHSITVFCAHLVWCVSVKYASLKGLYIFIL